MEESKREKDKITKEREAKKKDESITKLKLAIEVLHKESRKVIDELSTIKNNLIMHYHKLLAEGRDTRYLSTYII
jgi:hypothetical protein